MARAQPSWADCRRAARAVRNSPRRRTVVNTVRPREANGILRSRGPLPLLLYVADLEGRLVWRGPSGFAVLRPPTAAPVARPPLPLVPSLLRLLDRHWGIVMFAVPPAFVVLSVAALLPFRPLTSVALVMALLLALLAMLYVIAIMVSMVVLQILTAVRRSPDATAADDLITRHWSTVLLHLADEDDTDLLFDLVRDRLGRLVTAQVHDAARRQGGRTDDVTVVDPLVCLASGITTDAVRRRLASAAGVLVPFGQDSELMLLMADTRADDDEERPAFHVPFLRPFTAAVAAVLLLLPLVMTGPERAACRSAGCASALTTYGRALHWLSFQFIWQDVPGLRPSSDLFVYGFSVHFLLPTTVLVGIRATRRLAMEHRAALRRVQRAKDKAMGRTRVMIMTVNSGERDAVLSAAKEFTQEPAWRNFTANLTVYELGVINETRVSVVQAGEQGTTTPAGAPMSTASAIRHLAPDYAIITGICYGLQPHDQAMGDVLVSQRIRDLDLGGLKDDGTGVVERGRGENLQPSHVLLNRCQAAQSDWDGTAVHFGEMLAWNKLVNSERTVLRLRDEYPTAIGGEMEGAGFNSAARRAGVDWILVKGISDWGYGKTSDHQPAAAGNAARFVLHMIAIGALRTRPADLHG